MKWENWVGLLGLALISVGHYQGLFVAPPEAMMGDVGRILYAHVPTAWVALVVYLVAFVAAVGSLGSGRRGWDALVESAVEVGVVLNLLLLFQGAVWAKPTWGVFWTWDPRLTTTLLGALIFVSYLVLRGGAGSGEAEKRFSAALAVMGACVMPVIHYSVQLWRGQHPTVITSRGGGVSAAMGQTLTMGFLAFTLLAAVLLTLRSRLVLQRAKLEALRTDAVARGLLDGEVA